MSLTKPGASSAQQSILLVIMTNRNKAEKIAAIVLLGVLVVIFCLQNFAHAQPEIQKHPYQFGKQAGLIAFYQVDDSCDSTAPAFTDQQHITEQWKQHE